MSGTIALPITIKKQREEKTFEVRIPEMPTPLKKNKFVKAFFTVLSSPVN